MNVGYLPVFDNWLRLALLRPQSAEMFYKYLALWILFEDILSVHEPSKCLFLEFSTSDGNTLNIYFNVE